MRKPHQSVPMRFSLVSSIYDMLRVRARVRVADWFGLGLGLGLGQG